MDTDKLINIKENLSNENNKELKPGMALSLSDSSPYKIPNERCPNISNSRSSCDCKNLQSTALDLSPEVYNAPLPWIIHDNSYQHVKEKLIIDSIVANQEFTDLLKQIVILLSDIYSHQERSRGKRLKDGDGTSDTSTNSSDENVIPMKVDEASKLDLNTNHKVSSAYDVISDLYDAEANISIAHLLELTPSLRSKTKAGLSKTAQKQRNLLADNPSKKQWIMKVILWS